MGVPGNANPLPSKADIEARYSYDSDTGIFTRKTGTAAENTNGAGYVTLRINNKLWLAHRLAWMVVYNEDPGDRQIDHINRNRSDNRIANLRIVERQANNFNRGVRSDNRSGIKGVRLRSDTNRWAARIRKDGKFICLGCFDTKEQAQVAYDKAAVELFGELAATNAQLQEVTA